MSLGSRVLITGGAGFLGRGILRRAKEENWDTQFIVYSRDEAKQDECRKKYPDAIYVLGDVTDSERLSNVMAQTDPTTVIHAAAIKYVPDAEFNVSQCVEVNVEGTRNVLWNSSHYFFEPFGIDKVIFISTDKACRPVNTYGMTKALGERLIGEYASSYKKIKFTGTRYGNVIGSTGSVIPFFDKLSKAGQPIKITDTNMTRFWMSINDAVDCILEAANAESGTIIVPKCLSMNIGDVARSIAPLSTLEYIGVRPGEKTYEELIHAQESQRVTDGGKYYYQLHPAGTMESTLPRFQYNSDEPRMWMRPEDLVRAYEDSKCV